MGDDFPGIHDDALYPGHLVKRLLREHPKREPEVVTTAWLAENIGMSQEWWADAARAGRVPGAFQASEGSPWYLPLAAARAHLLRVQQRSTRNPLGVARGPYRRAS